MSHPLIGGSGDRSSIRFETSDPKQPVMIDRMLVRRDSKPLRIRIERFGHQVTLCIDEGTGNSPADLKDTG
jgi:hypothetical protein